MCKSLRQIGKNVFTTSKIYFEHRIRDYDYSNEIVVYKIAEPAQNVNYWDFTAAKDLSPSLMTIMNTKAKVHPKNELYCFCHIGDCKHEMHP